MARMNAMCWISGRPSRSSRRRCWFPFTAAVSWAATKRLPVLLKECLDSGISVAAITYRFSTQAIAPAPFQDGARAVQFLRTKNGQPCVRGMRLTVRRVVESVSLYPNRDDLLRNYPELEPEDIQQALAFAAANLEDSAAETDAA